MCFEDRHVPFRIRHVQDRHRAVELPHGGAHGGRTALSSTRRQRPRCRAQPPHRHASWLARLHRQGDGTDRACDPGSCGREAAEHGSDRVDGVLRDMAERGTVRIAEDHAVAFNPARDVIFDFGPALKGHANGLVFRILDDDNNTLLAETYSRSAAVFVRRRQSVPPPWPPARARSPRRTYPIPSAPQQRCWRWAAAPASPSDDEARE